MAIGASRISRRGRRWPGRSAGASGSIGDSPRKVHCSRLDRPFNLGRSFDLAMSFEVAEHLPPDAAKGFVDSLTRLAPLVLFSAAIPFQGGVGHINEQWPEYWA